jgi:hypothetical protein
MDGRHAIVWSDETTEVCFQVATMIPSRESHRRGENKKRHIGNAFVLIVFNEDGACVQACVLVPAALGSAPSACSYPAAADANYRETLMSSQVNLVHIVIEPLDSGSYLVRRSSAQRKLPASPLPSRQVLTVARAGPRDVQAGGRPAAVWPAGAGHDAGTWQRAVRSAHLHLTPRRGACAGHLRGVSDDAGAGHRHSCHHDLSPAAQER